MSQRHSDRLGGRRCEPHFNDIVLVAPTLDDVRARGLLIDVETIHLDRGYDFARVQLDVFVAGIGTGGTITGVGQVLKEHNPSIRVAAVEPEESPVLWGGSPAPRRIQGIAAGFVPAILDTDVYDEVMKLSAPDAADVARRLAGSEGILAGNSSGAALCVAVRLAERCSLN